jgi:hypothetical protein
MVGRDAVDIKPAAHACADGDVRVGGKKIAQLAVSENPREDDAQRCIGPGVIVLVEPEIAEGVALLVVPERKPCLQSQSASLFDVHLTQRAMRECQRQNKERHHSHVGVPTIPSLKRRHDNLTPTSPQC